MTRPYWWSRTIPTSAGWSLALAGRAGIGGLEAADGREGIRAFFDHRPDLVVLDIGLPELDGWQVLARIRELSEAPVLVLTAAGEKPQKLRGLDERRRRLRDQALRPRRADRPDPGAAAAPAAPSRRGSTSSPTAWSASTRRSGGSKWATGRCS